jgi:endonuclease/exonuclease/phosphatase family metal-dependent hydrolase
MIVLSKFEIVKSGTVRKESSENNQIIYADLKTPKGIIRVYNVHLQSHRITQEELQSTEQNKWKITLRKLKRGFQNRGPQITQLEQNIAKAPYPVLVCGDFNEMPYGYSYQRLKKTLNNSFENAGFGFGFTYNGPIPFLRIDNQFADKRMEISNFKTLSNLGWSDHFPIMATYTLKTNPK